MAAQRVRRRKRRNNGNIIVAIVLLLIIALISFLGATIWQNLSEKEKEPAQQSSLVEQEPIGEDPIDEAKEPEPEEAPVEVASNIDRVNNILREGDFRFSYCEVTYREGVNVNSYTHYYSYNDNFPSDATAMIDSFVKMIFAETQNADVYVRSAEWVKLLKEGDVTGGGADITIDSELSDTSENAVQNKAVANALNEKADASSLEESNQKIMGVIESVSLDIGEMIGAANLSINELYNTKQDKIDDLEAIRSGAALGATALQSVPSTYATKTDVDNAIANAITTTLNTEV